MKMTQHIHQRLRLKNRLITLTLIGLLIGLARISYLYPLQIDTSSNASNTLSDNSKKILGHLTAPVKLTVYLKNPHLQQQTTLLLNKYRRIKDDISVTFVDPDNAPEQVRKYNIDVQGAIIIEYLTETKKIVFMDEASLSNALLQLASSTQRWVSFLVGHGEPSPAGRANFDFNVFTQQLSQHKITSYGVNLAKIASIPDNTHLLVLSSPKVPLLAAELTLIEQYIAQGKNLLLITDPNNQHLQPIEQQLGIKKLIGTVVDGGSTLYGVDDPSFILVDKYTRHPITLNFSHITVFPVTAALSVVDNMLFKQEALLTSSSQSWTETDKISGKISFNANSQETKGPLTFAYALSRPLANNKEQRIVVLGDGDFLSNTYLGNVGNAELGFRLINWLTHNDQFIEISKKKSMGKSLALSQMAIAVMGVVFLFIFPLILIITGVIIWRKRKQR